MFGFRKKRGHDDAIRKDVAAVLADERRTDGSMRRTSWRSHGPMNVELWLETFGPYEDDIALDAPHELPAYRRHVAERLALVEAFSSMPEQQFGPKNPDCLRSLILSRMDTYVANGPTLTFAAEWTIYEQVLSFFGLRPLT